MLAFAAILIFFGLAAGFPFVAVIGFVLLFPALIIPSRPPLPGKVEQKRSEPTRSAPATMPTARQAPPVTPAGMDVQHVSMSSQPSASAALFPNVIFPSLSPVPAAPSAPQAAKEGAAEQRDEVVELGFILAVVKALVG